MTNSIRFFFSAVLLSCVVGCSRNAEAPSCTQQPATTGNIVTYSYDKDGRLTSSQVSGESAVPQQPTTVNSVTYSYDKDGRLTGSQISGESVSAPSGENTAPSK